MGEKGTALELRPPDGASPWYEKVAWQLDQAFRVPGTNFRFGWDAILGLVPGVGDAVTGVFQVALIIAIARGGAFPVAVLLRMLANVALDNTLGAIPLLGDVFDFFFKANTRNLKLVRRVQEEHRTTGRVSRRRHVLYLLSIVALLFAFTVASVVAAIFVTRWCWQYLQTVFS